MYDKIHYKLKNKKIKKKKNPMVKSRLKWQVQNTVSSSVLFSLLVSDLIISLSSDRKL